MSYFLIHQGPSLSLRSNVDRTNYGKLQKRKVVVCCCPWSEKKNKLVPQGKPFEDSNSNSTTKNTFFPFNIVSYLLSLGPLSMIINKTGKRKKLPPTPSFLDLISHYSVEPRPPYDALRDLTNKCGPLLYMELGERSMVFVSSAEIAKEVTRTHDPAYAERPKFSNMQKLMYNTTDFAFHEYDEYWKQMRSLCISELLSPKKVGSLEPIRKEEGSAIIDSIQTGVPFNLSDKIYLYTFTVACRAVFGTVPVVKGKALMSIIREVLLLTGSVSVIDIFPSIKALDFMSLEKKKLEKFWRQMDNILEGLIDIEHRSSKDGDESFVDVLLRLKESGTLEYPITDDNIKALAIDMVVPASETSSSLADWAMAELMRNPSVMAKVQDEIRQAFEGNKTIQECDIGKLKYLKLVIMETLRLHPPTPFNVRSCREEVEVDGYHIPLNSYIIINSWAIGRDPTYWKNPENFEPERFVENPVNFSGTHSEFIPFGSGKRVCPGMTFSLAQVQFILGQLLFHFDWELPPGNDLDMTDVGAFAYSRKTPLYLIAKPC